MKLSTTSSSIQPDLKAIQKLPLQGYDFHCCRYLLLTIANPGSARSFLARLATDGWLSVVSHARTHVATGLQQHRCPVNVGLSFQGLLALGLTARYQAVFKNKAVAFAEGAYARAAAHLADTGLNAVRFWDVAFQPHSAHVLLSLHADDQTLLDKCQAALKDLAGDAFAHWTTSYQGQHLDANDESRKKRRVHFDMLDGISQPRIAGFSEDTTEPIHEPGEFILGFENDQKCNPWRLSNEHPDLSDTPATEQSAPIADFFKNASFGVFRPMAQNVQAFDDFVEKNAAQLNQSKTYVRAKLLGRKEDGSLLVPPGQAAPTDNKFDFSKDPDGYGCPFGAHIRRMNPRADAVVPFRKRPLLRRGIPYGPKFDGSNGAVERGLLGLFFCASLEDQFEHLLKEWGNANPMGVPNRGNANDPLIGNHAQARSNFEVPQSGENRLSFEYFNPFVRTKGTLYTFFPGLNGLLRLDDPKVFAQ